MNRFVKAGGAALAVLTFLVSPMISECNADSTDSMQTPSVILEQPSASEPVVEETFVELIEQDFAEETIPEETVLFQSFVEEPVYEYVTYDEVPLYFQTDYPDVMYGAGTVADSGCGITSLAMVATYMTGYEYMPDTLADYFGGDASNYIARLECASDGLQLPYRKAKNVHDAFNALKEGNLVIAMMNERSIFTDSQHFIVLTGMTEDGKILVNDPYEPNYEHWQLKNGLENGFSQGDIICGFSGAWIYDVSAMPEEPFIYVEEEAAPTEYRYTGIELTKEEIDLLASIVYLESQGEPAEGQQAVAESILNRLVSDNFPDTLKGNIYADGQFCSLKHLDTAEPNQTQYEAVERALYGPYILPIDVVYFAVYPLNENIWGEIGGHYFCYDH